MGEIGKIWVELYLKGVGAFVADMAKVTSAVVGFSTPSARFTSAATQMAQALNSFSASTRAMRSAMSALSRGFDTWGSGMRAVHSTVSAAAGSVKSLGSALSSLAKSGFGAIGSAAMNAAVVNKSAMRIIVDDFAAVAKAVRSVASILRNLPTLVIPILGHIGSAFSTMFQGVVSVAKGAVSLITYPFRKLWDFVFSIKGAIAALGVSLSAHALTRYLVDVTADAEDAAISFTAMLGSSSKAVAMLKQIKQLADTTPLELPEVRDASRAMVAFGFAANDVVGRLRMLGDVSQGLSLPLGDLVQIYGKVFETGRVAGTEFRQFGRRGIPVLSELAAILRVSKEEVRKMGSEGKITFAHLDAAFKRLTGEGGRFFNLLEEKGKSIRGRISTMHDALRSIGTELGGSLSPILKTAIDAGINLLNRFNEKLSVYRERIAAWADGVGNRITAFGQSLLAAFETAQPFVVEFIKTAAAVKGAISEIGAEIASTVVKWIGGNGAIGAGVMGLMRWTRFLADNWRLAGGLGLAYIHQWATDGVAFVKEFGRQLGANLAKIFDNLAPAFKNLGVLIEAVFTLAIKKAVRAAMPDKLARWFGIDQADANEKAIETAIPFLGQMLGNSLKQAFDNLPGFDLAGVFGAGQSQEVIDALKKLNAAKLGFDKADAMQPAIDAFFEAKRRAETLFAEEPGGGGPGKVAAGGGKGFRAEFLDPVAFYKKLQGGVNSNAEKARDNRQVAMAKDLHDVAEHFRRQPNKVGRPMPAVLA